MVLVLDNMASRYSFFFQAEDGIRDLYVTGVQTCALPISEGGQHALLGLVETACQEAGRRAAVPPDRRDRHQQARVVGGLEQVLEPPRPRRSRVKSVGREIGRASCRERVEMAVGAGVVQKK